MDTTDIVIFLVLWLIFGWEVAIVGLAMLAGFVFLIKRKVI